VTSPRLSADGLFYWDGKQWASALSPDGRHRWDGSSWVTMALAPPPAYAAQPGFTPPTAAPPAGRPSRVTTSWTRPLQLAVGGLAAVTSAWYAALPFWVTGLMSDEIRQRALRAAAANPGLYPNPSQYADGVTTFAVILLDMVSIVYVAIALVVLIGALRRWTWIYYAVLVLLGFLVIGLPSAFAAALGISQPAPALGGSLVVVQWTAVALGVISTALFAWMLVALLRRGPWATRKPAEG
jgi:hypothetical protein